MVDLVCSNLTSTAAVLCQVPGFMSRQARAGAQQRARAGMSRSVSIIACRTGRHWIGHAGSGGEAMSIPLVGWLLATVASHSQHGAPYLKAWPPRCPWHSPPWVLPSSVFCTFLWPLFSDCFSFSFSPSSSCCLTSLPCCSFPR